MAEEPFPATVSVAVRELVFCNYSLRLRDSVFVQLLNSAENNRASDMHHNLELNLNFDTTPEPCLSNNKISNVSC